MSLTLKEIIRDTWASRPGNGPLDEDWRRDLPIRDTCKLALNKHFQNGDAPSFVTFHNDGGAITGELGSERLVVARKPPSFS